jgi:FeS assembly SUF system regulator
MLKISKLADYGMVLMHILTKNGSLKKSAKQISDVSHLPLPTVSKLLKQLCESGFVESERGVQGGYRLKCAPETISAADVIRAIDGDIALTECAMAESRCSLLEHCELKSNWQYINNQVNELLSTISIVDMQKSMMTESVSGE